MKTDKFKDAISLLQELIRIRSPYFEEEAAIEYVNAWLIRNNIPSRIQEYSEDTVTGFKGKNVISMIDSGNPGPTLYFNGHLDTVKLCQGWTKDPYGGEIEDGRVYGLGALDMKGGCAAILTAIKEFLKDNETFKGKIISSFVSDEEGPYGLGTSAVIAEGLLQDVDVSICAEPSAGFTKAAFPCICLGARGAYGLSVEFYGASAHAANPDLGVNAAVEAAKVLTNLDKITFTADDCLGEGCLCVVKVESDGGACSVPDYAKVDIFWHIVRGDTKETIVAALKNVIALSGVTCDYKISFREAPNQATDGLLPYIIPEDNPYVTVLAASAKEVTGNAPTLNYFDSNGDFNYLGTLIDAPCIIFGPNGENYHSADEYATVSSILGTTAAIYKFLIKSLT